MQVLRPAGDCLGFTCWVWEVLGATCILLEHHCLFCRSGSLPALPATCRCTCLLTCRRCHRAAPATATCCLHLCIGHYLGAYCSVHFKPCTCVFRCLGVLFCSFDFLFWSAFYLPGTWVSPASCHFLFCSAWNFCHAPISALLGAWESAFCSARCTFTAVWRCCTVPGITFYRYLEFWCLPPGCCWSAWAASTYGLSVPAPAACSGLFVLHFDSGFTCLFCLQFYRCSAWAHCLGAVLQVPAAAFWAAGYLPPVHLGVHLPLGGADSGAVLCLCHSHLPAPLQVPAFWVGVPPQVSCILFLEAGGGVPGCSPFCVSGLVPLSLSLYLEAFLGATGPVLLFSVSSAGSLFYRSTLLGLLPLPATACASTDQFHFLHRLGVPALHAAVLPPFLPRFWESWNSYLFSTTTICSPSLFCSAVLFLLLLFSAFLILCY